MRELRRANAALGMLALAVSHAGAAAEVARILKATLIETDPDDIDHETILIAMDRLKTAVDAESGAAT